MIGKISYEQVKAIEVRQVKRKKIITLDRGTLNKETKRKQIHSKHRSTTSKTECRERTEEPRVKICNPEKNIKHVHAETHWSTSSVTSETQTRLGRNTKEKWQTIIEAADTAYTAKKNLNH